MVDIDLSPFLTFVDLEDEDYKILILSLLVVVYYSIK